VVEPGVYGVPPVVYDDWGRWMGATMTAPGSLLSHASAAAAFGFWDLPRQFEMVTRPGSGGPRRHGGVLVYRSGTLEDDADRLRGIPTMRIERTLLDLAAGGLSDQALARALREAIRNTRLTLTAMGEALGGYRGRRGSRRLANCVARYAGLPLGRARSGAEIRAMEILRAAGHPLPRLNRRIAGEEADLSWADRRLIIEVDGGPFHLDVGEDARKEGIWRAAGWTVRRIGSDDIYNRPYLLRDLVDA